MKNLFAFFLLALSTHASANPDDGYLIKYDTETHSVILLNGKGNDPTKWEKHIVLLDENGRAMDTDPLTADLITEWLK